MKSLKEGILQNKTVNNAVCGNIEKLNGTMKIYENQM
jgi:hypothetical protein